MEENCTVSQNPHKVVALRDDDDDDDERNQSIKVKKLYKMNHYAITSSR